jgi:GNAT superfamily N-acetyltransferase
MHIRQALIADLDALVPLFDGYRQFYKQPSDPAGARAFLADRFEHQQSVVFMAFEEADDGDGAAIGFVQLYPLFTSALMKRMFLLNDLYVAPAGRQRGTGGALLDAAADYAKQVGAVRLMLRTATDNLTAQSVYEAGGWVKDEAFFTYNLAID